MSHRRGCLPSQQLRWVGALAQRRLVPWAAASTCRATAHSSPRHHRAELTLEGSISLASTTWQGVLLPQRNCNQNTSRASNKQHNNIKSTTLRHRHRTSAWALCTHAQRSHSLHPASSSVPAACRHLTYLSPRRPCVPAAARAVPVATKYASGAAQELAQRHAGAAACSAATEVAASREPPEATAARAARSAIVWKYVKLTKVS